MPSRPPVVTYIRTRIAFLVNKSSGQQQTAANSSRQHTRLEQQSHRQMKLSSVLHLLLIIFRRRSKRVGLVLSCVWFSTKLARSENGDSSSWESAAVLCCRIGFLPERSPHAAHDYGSYRARHSLLNASSIVFLMLTLPPHPADRACIAVCVVFKPSWWM